jgi:2'-hydroxyisoflavone reductase
MDVLVIGGGIFLGRAMVAEALARGDRVAVFNRGRSGPTPVGAEQIVGDRTVAADLEQLRGRRFDLVVDTSGYVPADVGPGAEILAPSCGHYAFVSSINAFPEWPQRADYQAAGTHDGDPDATRDDVPDGYTAAQSYGWLKVGCERAVARAFGENRTTVLRAGCIVGPHDSAVGRLPWWIARVARGGEVLVPGAPDDDVALIDARDLAAFALRAVPSVFETAGPSGRDTRGDLLSACCDVTGSAATFTYVGDEWPVEQGVAPWTELPLWAPGAPGVFAQDAGAAIAAGLTWRPLRHTVADTWAGQRGIEWHPADVTPGLAADRERALLARWHDR